MYDPILVTLSKTNPIIVNTVVKMPPHLVAFYKEVTSPLCRKCIVSKFLLLLAICINLYEKDLIFLMEGVFSLTGDGDYARCSKSFLFTLVNPQGLEPTKMPITTDGQKYGICCYSEYGPTFGRGLYGGYALKISDHANVRSSDFGISDSYDFHQDFRTFFTGKTQFLVSDYEVFSLVN